MAKEKPQTTLADVEHNREVLKQKKAELRALRKRPRGKDEVKTELEAEIDRLAAEGRKRFVSICLSGTVSPLDMLPLPRAIPSRRRVDLSGYFSDFSRGMNIESLVFAFKDVLTKTAMAAIDAEWPDDAITAQERNAEIERLTADILAIEETEESFIRQLIAMGMSVDRRPDADPAIVLRFNGPDDWDRGTFDDLRGRAQGIRAIIKGHNDDIFPLVGANRDRETALRNAMLRDAQTEERLRSEIAQTQARIKELRGKVAALEPKLSDCNKLANACEQFLRDHGVRDVA